MAKTLFCFICKKSVEVNADEAIGALCPEHKNDETLDIMANKTTTRYLLSIQDEGLRLWVQDNQDANKIDINSIKKTLEDIQAQIAALPSETIVQAPTPTITTGGTVNEFGEII